jgi:hypothetical protein
MDDWQEHTLARFRAHLQRSVPPTIRRYLMKPNGGPDDDDLARLQTYAVNLGAHGDLLLYPDEQIDTTTLMQQLVDAVAILSFSPGGIRLFGLSFDAQAYRQDPQSERSELHQFLADIDSWLK